MSTTPEQRAELLALRKDVAMHTFPLAYDPDPESEIISDAGVLRFANYMETASIMAGLRQGTTSPPPATSPRSWRGKLRNWKRITSNSASAY